MNLRLVEMRPGPDEIRYWYPFKSSHGFNTDWWGRMRRTNQYASTYLSVTEGASEVARLELDDDVYLDNYRNVPVIRRRPLEIQFIEVHWEHRLRGIGKRTIDLLAEHHHDRTLVAFSENADGFWASLGWSRHTQKDDDEVAPRHRPLYIQTTY